MTAKSEGNKLTITVEPTTSEGNRFMEMTVENGDVFGMSQKHLFYVITKICVNNSPCQRQSTYDKDRILFVKAIKKVCQCLLAHFSI